MSAGNYNQKNPSIKRILSELREIEREKHRDYYAAPLEDNLFEWHFTIRGPDETEFEGGRYHGRIVLPPDYPFKPPSIILLTPNGRFEIGKKICLSITGYHPEYWQPAWGIRTALLAIISFLPTKAEGAIGGIDWSPEERKVLAEKSKTWICKVCGCDNASALDDDAANDTETDVDLSAFKLAYAKTTASTKSEDTKGDEQAGKDKEESNEVGDSVEGMRQRNISTHSAESTESAVSSSSSGRKVVTNKIIGSRQSSSTRANASNLRKEKVLNWLIVIIFIILLPLVLRRILMIFSF